MKDEEIDDSTSDADYTEFCGASSLCSDEEEAEAFPEEAKVSEVCGLPVVQKEGLRSMECGEKVKVSHKVLTLGLTTAARNARSERAVAWGPDGLGLPEVEICRDDFGGIGLYASRDFEANECVFVERALVATAISGSVRACGTCCRSLVAIDELINHRRPNEAERAAWPVPLTSATYCTNCETWFCDQCGADPSCCAVKTALDQLNPLAPPAARLAVVVRARSSLQAQFDSCALCGDSAEAQTLFGLSKYVDRSLLEKKECASTLAQAALNAFEAKLTSPFTALYSALARRYGRGSPRLHAALTELKAAAGCGPNDLDSAMRERCAITCAGIFTLAACINHDCNPNCFASSNFDQAHIEICTNTMIRKGQQLTLSYINLSACDGASAALRTSDERNDLRAAKRRQTQLRLNYLFRCQCSLCGKHAA